MIFSRILGVKISVRIYKNIVDQFDMYLVHMNCRLQAEKKALALKAEEMGRMQSENVEMSEQIESLAESHQ